MPMNTTLPRRRPSSRARRAARTTCSTISPVREVALEPGLAGGAEAAGHGAPGLGRDAHGRAVAVVHEHGLDAGAPVESEQPLHGCARAVDRLGHGRQGGRQVAVEAGPQGLGQRGQLGGRCELPVQAVPHLVDPVARLAGQDPGERVAVHVVAGGHPRQGTALAGLGRRYRASVPSFWRLVDADSARPRAAAGRPTAPRVRTPRVHHRDIQGGAARAAVFGVSDGLVSNMGLILGVAGADPQPAVVRLAGLAGLIAGAISMAAGEYNSMRVQSELLQRELRIEARELRRRPEHETGSWPTSTSSAASPPDQARDVAEAMMSDPEMALETHAPRGAGHRPRAARVAVGRGGVVVRVVLDRRAGPADPVVRDVGDRRQASRRWSSAWSPRWSWAGSSVDPPNGPSPGRSPARSCSRWCRR